MMGNALTDFIVLSESRVHSPLDIQFRFVYSCLLDVGYLLVVLSSCKSALSSSTGDIIPSVLQI